MMPTGNERLAKCCSLQVSGWKAATWTTWNLSVIWSIYGRRLWYICLIHNPTLWSIAGTIVDWDIPQKSKALLAFGHYRQPNPVIILIESLGLWACKCMQYKNTHTRIHIHLEIHMPRTPMTSIFEGQPPETNPFPIKTRVIWVPGTYTGITTCPPKTWTIKIKNSNNSSVKELHWEGSSFYDYARKGVSVYIYIFQT